jgi:hypothetical protein
MNAAPMIKSTLSKAVLLAVLSVTSVSAQTLEKAYMLAEPLQYTRQGQFRGCGVNLKVLQEIQSASRDYATVSVNFWLDNPGAALVKTTLGKATVGPSPSNRPQPFASSWVRVKGAAPLIAQKTMAGEDQSVLTIVELSSAIDFVTAVMQGGNEIQLGLKQSGVNHERIFYGDPVVEQESRKQLEACFGEFLDRLSKSPSK